MKLPVLYEDNHLLVVVKPANLPVNLDESADEDLLSLLKGYLKEKYHKPGNVYLGLVHRLDRPVGGVMVFARTSKAASRLARAMQSGGFAKSYLAVGCGKAAEEKQLRDYLTKDPGTNTSRVTDEKNGKLAVLSYRLLEYRDPLSLLKVDLQTGRSHQIRVQLSHDGLPLWGDQRYNPDARIGQQIALFACSLSFPHPITGQLLTFSARPEAREPWIRFDIERLCNESEKEEIQL